MLASIWLLNALPIPVVMFKTSKAVFYCKTKTVYAGVAFIPIQHTHTT